MKANVVLGIIGIIIGIYFSKFVTLGVSIAWLIAPCFACKISKESSEKEQVTTKEEKEYLNKIGEKTWKFFADNINEKNNYLPPDNYQEDRKQKVAYRTSPTNIGLGLLAVISAYDLKYIDEEKTLEMLEKMLFTIEKMPKWNGHLYNWYNTLNLEPLFPRYISTVDSGNLVGYLYIVKTFLQEKNKRRNTCKFN